MKLLIDKDQEAWNMQSLRAPIVYSIVIDKGQDTYM